ncbi:hypothetical protein NZK35_19025 [Stieleria sp. ICT_E10.1]|uniref:hypothetical protein n=1 Tax=Stieleria sedimenti TaxID=2976331 RepID=UPI00217F9FF0|nr:hypothetical protein [Stieleria sedimenti]MCS7468750.1 hypothetical protein [Stieleria sedimenti]
MIVVQSPSPNGVAIAQGGRQHGYALHFVDGKPALDVRVNGQVKRLQSGVAVSGKIELTATLSAETMTLAINGDSPISVESPGLIPVQPVDRLSVGFDDQTSAGNYSSPNRFNGQVLRHKVRALKIERAKDE